MATNPYTLRAAGSSGVPPTTPVLGSLAQSAREAELRKARGLLLFVGTLSIVVYGVFFLTAEAQVERALQRQIRDLERRGFVLNQAKVAELKEHAVRKTRYINAAAVGVGLVMLSLGSLVTRYPVPATMLSLVIYLAALAVLITIDRALVWKGLIVNMIVIYSLFQSVRAAFAYEDSDHRPRLRAKAGTAPGTLWHGAGA